MLISGTTYWFFPPLKSLRNVLQFSRNNLQNFGILSIWSEYVKSLELDDIIRTF